MRCLVLLLSFVTFVAPAAAQNSDRPFSENSGWTISYDAKDNVCSAAPKDEDGGLFLIRPDSRNIVIMVASRKLAWLTQDKEYDVVIHTDRRRWTGRMGAHSGEGKGGLFLVQPNEAFMAALRDAVRMTIRVDNANYGPFSLKGSSDTIRDLMRCAKALERGEFKPAEAQSLSPGSMREWSAADYGKSFTAGDWTLTLNGQDNVDGTATAYLTARHGKKGELTMKLETAPEGRGNGGIGVYDLDWGGPQVVFSAFSGGAHCCASVAIALATDDGVRQVDLGTFDGSGVEPVDIDGDEQYEFDVGDQRFLYAFSSYAESLAPVRILALRGGKVEDITRERGVRPLIEKRLTSSMQACLESSSAGACAGALANAALIGNFRAALGLILLDEVDNGMEKSYLACDDTELCGGRADFKSFEEALSFRLGAWGYDTASHLGAPARTLFASLAEARHGFGSKDAGADGEMGCEAGVLGFEVDPSGRLASVSGYEHRCNIENAVVLKQAVVAEQMCSGEGEFWIDRYVYEVDGPELLATPVSSTAPMVAERLSRCSAP